MLLENPQEARDISLKAPAAFGLYFSSCPKHSALIVPKTGVALYVDLFAFATHLTKKNPNKQQQPTKYTNNSGPFGF